jgi:hypothetical protein
MDGYHRVAAAIELGVESVTTRQLNIKKLTLMQKAFVDLVPLKL